MHIVALKGLPWRNKGFSFIHSTSLIRAFDQRFIFWEIYIGLNSLIVLTVSLFFFFPSSCPISSFRNNCLSPLSDSIERGLVQLSALTASNTYDNDVMEYPSQAFLFIFWYFNTFKHVNHSSNSLILVILFVHHGFTLFTKPKQATYNTGTICPVRSTHKPLVGKFRRIECYSEGYDQIWNG